MTIGLALAGIAAVAVAAHPRGARSLMGLGDVGGFGSDTFSSSSDERYAEILADRVTRAWEDVLEADPSFNDDFDIDRTSDQSSFCFEWKKRIQKAERSLDSARELSRSTRWGRVMKNLRGKMPKYTPPPREGYEFKPAPADEVAREYIDKSIRELKRLNDSRNRYCP